MAGGSLCHEGGSCIPAWTDDLVFEKRLESVEAPSGRRVVPLGTVEAWRLEHGARGVIRRSLRSR